MAFRLLWEKIRSIRGKIPMGQLTRGRGSEGVADNLKAGLGSHGVVPGRWRGTVAERAAADGHSDATGSESLHGGGATPR